MNIEIANRLVELRKKNNLSQEALAEKLGISRQAVSKWERAEASPDTDNLIMLARIYRVSLDELLKTEDFSGLREEAPHAKELLPDKEEDGQWQEHLSGKEEEMHDKREEAPKVEMVYEKPGEPLKVKMVYEKPGNLVTTMWASCMQGLPLGAIVTSVYLFIGCIWDLWHPGWLLFFLPPILDSLAKSVRKRNAKYFAYPVLVTLVYLVLGIYLDLWHPGWLIFLTIPAYYPLLNYIQRIIREQDRELGL